MILDAGVQDWVQNICRQDGNLTSADQAKLGSIFTGVLAAKADVDVVSGDAPQAKSHLLLEGWAARYITLADGRRQFVSLHVPGDILDLHSFPLPVLDYSVVTFTPCRVALAPHRRLRAAVTAYPAFAHFLWMSALIDAAILRQWLVRTAKRPALERAAHFFCELFSRLQFAGQIADETFFFPLSQAELADCLGLSGVHANRVVQDLRARNLVDWRGRQVRIVDWIRLKALAEFDAAYITPWSRELAPDTVGSTDGRQPRQHPQAAASNATRSRI